MNQEEQKLLLKIVQTWNPNQVPEYRGFRCANCQEYKNIVYYHLLDFGGYKLFVHLCRDGCEQAFQNHSLNVDETKRKPIDLSRFGFEYPEKTQERFREIVDSWEYRKPKPTRFFCDNCGGDLKSDPLVEGYVQGYHLWWGIPPGQILAELHFHRDCANKLGIH